MCTSNQSLHYFPNDIVLWLSFHQNFHVAIAITRVLPGVFPLPYLTKNMLCTQKIWIRLCDLIGCTTQRTNNQNAIISILKRKRCIHLLFWDWILGGSFDSVQSWVSQIKDHKRQEAAAVTASTPQTIFTGIVHLVSAECLHLHHQFNVSSIDTVIRAGV